MQVTCFVAWLVAAPLLAIGQEAAPHSATVRLSSDLATEVELDGKPLGTVRPGLSLHVDAAPGDHLLLAKPEGGGPAWRKEITISPTQQNDLAIPMRTHLLRTQIQRDGYWVDVRTGLQWAAADNGSGATVSQARHYCGRLTLGGTVDWRLPTIDELQTIFGGQADERGFRVIAPLRLTGWAWSASEGNEPAENWALDFGDGARASVVAGDAGLNRALCVRSARNPEPHAKR